MSIVRRVLSLDGTLALLWEKVDRKFIRDKDVPLNIRVRKAWRFGSALSLGRVFLSGCDKVGVRARVRGRPWIENAGCIEIGHDFNLVSYCVQSHLVTGPGALLRIGDDVSINFGAAISSQESIVVGSRVRMGPYVMILDSDYHGTHDRDETPTAPVVIEDDVWLAGRVSVLRGSRIGKGSVIMAGSVVSGVIPAGVVAGGVPARVIRRLDETPVVASVKVVAKKVLESSLEQDVLSLATKVFEQPVSEPKVFDACLSGWSSLEQLKFVLELETHFDIQLTADDVSLMRCFDDVVGVLQKKHGPAVSSERMCVADLRVSAQAYPNKKAMVCGGVSLTYSACVKKMRACASYVCGKGLSKGDKVLVWVKNPIDYVCAVYGVWMAGGVVVPVHGDASLESVMEMVSVAKPFCVLLDKDKKVHATHVVLERVDVACGDEEEEGWVPVEVSEEDMALVMFTSGTSGAKKAVCLSHKNIAQSARHIASYMEMDASMVEYICVPLTHSFGLGRVRSLFLCGGTAVFDEGVFNPLVAVERVVEQGCQVLSCVPAQISLFSVKEEWMSVLASRVRLLEMGSSFMPAEEKEKLQRQWPFTRICMHYGLTEASRSTFLDFKKDHACLDSVGKPSSGVVVDVCREDGTACNVLEEGELVVKGDHVMMGYLDDHGCLKACEPLGVINTKDRGFIDEAGYVHFLGRMDDTINMRGVKISPVRIESVVQECFPGTVCCVVGMPHKDVLVGEEPCLVFEKSTALDVSDKDVLDVLGKRLEKSHVPKRVVRMDSFPLTENGKIRRKEVKKRLGEQGGGV